MLNKILKTLYFVFISLMVTENSWSEDSCLEEMRGKYLGSLYYYDQEVGLTSDGNFVGELYLYKNNINLKKSCDYEYKKIIDAIKNEIHLLNKAGGIKYDCNNYARIYDRKKKEYYEIKQDTYINCTSPVKFTDKNFITLLTMKLYENYYILLHKAK